MVTAHLLLNLCHRRHSYHTINDDITRNYPLPQAERCSSKLNKLCLWETLMLLNNGSYFISSKLTSIVQPMVLGNTCIANARY